MDRKTQFAKNTCRSKNKSDGVSPTPAKQILAKHPNTPPILDKRNDIELLLSINTDDQKIIDQIVDAIKIKINEFDPKYSLKINISSNQQPISEKKLEKPLSNIKNIIVR